MIFPHISLQYEIHMHDGNIEMFVHEPSVEIAAKKILDDIIQKVKKHTVN